MVWLVTTGPEVLIELTAGANFVGANEASGIAVMDGAFVAVRPMLPVSTGIGDTGRAVKDRAVVGIEFVARTKAVGVGGCVSVGLGVMVPIAIVGVCILVKLAVGASAPDTLLLLRPLKRTTIKPINPMQKMAPENKSRYFQLFRLISGSGAVAKAAR